MMETSCNAAYLPAAGNGRAFRFNQPSFTGNDASKRKGIFMNGKSLIASLLALGLAAAAAAPAFAQG
ncbi:MAG: hypothetical protein WA924_00340, partial [Burkholderiaceae bacterium]